MATNGANDDVYQLATPSRTVILQRDPELGFGFSIVGGEVEDTEGTRPTPILISKLKPNAPAERSGRIEVGHIILGINGSSLEGATHEQAVAMLKSSPPTMELMLADNVIDWTIAGSAGGSAYLPARAQGLEQLLPAAFERVSMLYNFVSTRPDELDLRAGDIIDVIGKNRDGWCIGTCTRTKQTGFFPGNFAMRVRAAPAMESIYSEIDNYRGVQECLYEELPDSAKGQQRDAPPAPVSPKAEAAEASEKATPAKEKEEEEEPSAPLPLYSLPVRGKSKTKITAYVERPATAIEQLYTTVAHAQKLKASKDGAQAGEEIYATISKPEEAPPPIPERGYDDPTVNQMIYQANKETGDVSESNYEALDNYQVPSNRKSTIYKSTSDMGHVDEMYDVLPPVHSQPLYQTTTKGSGEIEEEEEDGAPSALPAHPALPPALPSRRPTHEAVVPLPPLSKEDARRLARERARAEREADKAEKARVKAEREEEKKRVKESKAEAKRLEKEKKETEKMEKKRQKEEERRRRSTRSKPEAGVQEVAVSAVEAEAVVKAEAEAEAEAEVPVSADNTQEAAAKDS